MKSIWEKHKQWILVGGVFAVAIIGGLSENATPPTQPYVPARITQETSPATSSKSHNPAKAAAGGSTSTTVHEPIAPQIIPSADVKAPVYHQPTIDQNLTSSTIATPTTTPLTSQSDPPEITIDPQVLVGVLCYYDITATNNLTSASQLLDVSQEVRGSGVIIDSNGDILTNRHIIIQPNDHTTITDDSGNIVPITLSYKLNHCEVGQLPKNTTLPTADEIKTMNPYVQIPVLLTFPN